MYLLSDVHECMYIMYRLYMGMYYVYVHVCAHVYVCSIEQL